MSLESASVGSGDYKFEDGCRLEAILAATSIAHLNETQISPHCG